MTEDERRSGMQRVRVGLTGLAVVLLIVALATALLNTVDRQVETNGSAAAPAKVEKTENEPLADLGMAPGAPGGNQAAPPPPPVAPTLPEQP